MEIGGLRARRGECRRGKLVVGTRPGGAPLEIPFFLIAGVGDGPVLLVDACNHGSEYEGPPAVIRLARQLDPRALNGTVIAVPVVNLPSFEEGRRSSSIDGLNINRVWPGDPAGTITQQIAHYYFEQVVRLADYVVTHHSGGRDLQHPPLVAFQEEADAHGRRSRALAHAFGTQFLTRWTPFDGSLVRETWKLGIVTINPEAGGVDRGTKVFWENVEQLFQGTLNVMGHLGMIDRKPVLPARQIVTHVIANPPLSYPRLRHGGLFYPEVEIGEPVKKKQQVGHLTDLYGDVIQRIEAPFAGILIGLHNDPLGFPGEFAAIFGKSSDS